MSHHPWANQTEEELWRAKRRMWLFIGTVGVVLTALFVVQAKISILNTASAPQPLISNTDGYAELRDSVFNAYEASSDSLDQTFDALKQVDGAKNAVIDRVAEDLVNGSNSEELILIEGMDPADFLDENESKEEVDSETESDKLEAESS